MTGRPPAVQAALDQLGAAFEALDPGARLPLAQQTLTAARRPGVQPQERPLMLALHSLCSGATDERLDRLVSVLETVGAPVRHVVRHVARTAQANDPPRAAVWTAVAALVDAIEP